MILDMATRHSAAPPMKAAFCITAIAALLSLTHSAVHARSVRGRVVDALTADPAPLAMVTLVRADSVHARAITAANGEFALPAPTAGDWCPFASPTVVCSRIWIICSRTSIYAE